MREVRQRRKEDNSGGVDYTPLCVMSGPTVFAPSGTSTEHTSEFLTEAWRTLRFLFTSSHPSRLRDFLWVFSTPSSFLPDPESAMPSGQRVPLRPREYPAAKGSGAISRQIRVAAGILQGRQMSHDWNTITICCGSFFCPFVTEREPLPNPAPALSPVFKCFLSPSDPREPLSLFVLHPALHPPALDPGVLNGKCSPLQNHTKQSKNKSLQREWPEVNPKLSLGREMAVM